MLMSTDSDKPVHKLHDLKTYHVGVVEAAAHRAMRQHKDDLLRAYGITSIEWYIIGTVADAGKKGMRITDLAVLLGTSQGFLTKTVNLLEAKGILSRKANAHDARSNFVILNKRYAKTIDDIEEALRNKLRKSVYSRITPEQLQYYIDVLTKFRDLA